MHIKFSPNNNSPGHRDIYIYIPGILQLNITDSYYFLEFGEYKQFQNKGYPLSLKKLLASYIKYGTNLIKELNVDQQLYFPLGLYDENTAGLLIQQSEKGQISIKYGYKLEYGFQITSTFKDTIRLYPISEDIGFKIVRKERRYPRSVIIDNFHKAAENIQIVDNFDFLLSWKP